MTTTLPRPLPRSGLHHEAHLYEGLEGFLDAALPFVRAAVAAGQPALVVVSAEKIALLGEHLGTDVAGVVFADMAELGSNPARLIPAWRAFVEAHPGHELRGIGEPVWPERTPAELDECRLHEALLNVAFDDDRPWRLRCPYDVAALPERVVAEAHRTHPYVRRQRELAASDVYPGRDGMAGLFAEVLPEPTGVAAELTFGVGPLDSLRAVVVAFAHEAGLRYEVVDDLLLATTEVVTNSLRHGGGRGVVRLWRDALGVVCEVRDAGRIASPLAGRVEPDLEGAGGRGLWMVNQLCALVQVRSSDAGTVVRLHAHR